MTVAWLQSYPCCSPENVAQFGIVNTVVTVLTHVLRFAAYGEGADMSSLYVERRRYTGHNR